jgi:8-oxo-dGTP diphosphatase
MAEKEASVKGYDDAVRAGWFPVDQLPELAFDHELIVTEFMQFTSGHGPGRS